MPTKTLVDTDSVQTLSNKTLTAPTLSGAISGSPTIIATGMNVSRSLQDLTGDIRNVKGYAQSQTGYAEAVADAIRGLLKRYHEKQDWELTIR